MSDVVSTFYWICMIILPPKVCNDDAPISKFQIFDGDWFNLWMCIKITSPFVWLWNPLNILFIGFAQNSFSISCWVTHHRSCNNLPLKYIFRIRTPLILKILIIFSPQHNLTTKAKPAKKWTSTSRNSDALFLSCSMTYLKQKIHKQALQTCLLIYPTEGHTWIETMIQVEEPQLRES